MGFLSREDDDNGWGSSESDFKKCDFDRFIESKRQEELYNLESRIENLEKENLALKEQIIKLKRRKTVPPTLK